MTITSEAARTSPVKRGKWFLQTFLGVSPPDPPPGVVVKLDQVAGETPKTMRARLQIHSINPTCATCHKMFEPLGLAMENFDPVGEWRTTEVGTPDRLARRRHRRHSRPGYQRSARPRGAQAPDVRGSGDRKPADLRHRSRSRLQRHAVGPFAGGERREGQLQVFSADHGRRPKSGLHHEYQISPQVPCPPQIR